MNMFKDLIEKIKVWGERDWNNNVDEDGRFWVYGVNGGIDYEVSRLDYFGELEKVKNFEDLNNWWMSIIGMDGDGGFGEWLDEVMKG